ncbi:hypothetical protein [Micromonospora sp. WMMD1219]|uniref:hypothetical protein n=1 Tax=Micromonospora sp. WMMD1219 TaxID=3404115 RepID=UPI003BF53259
MSASAGRSRTGWETLTPWEKAAQWQDAAPQIADQVVELAKRHAEHQWQMELEKAAHDRMMDKRLWLTQIATVSIGFINVIALAFVAWHYADTGNVAPGLAMFGAGTGLTAGTYVAGNAIGKRAARSSAVL